MNNFVTFWVILSMGNDIHKWYYFCWDFNLEISLIAASFAEWDLKT